MKEMIDSEHENIVIVSHGITLHLLFSMWIGLKFEQLTKFGTWGMAGGVSKLLLNDNGRREIQYLNNLSFQSHK